MKARQAITTFLIVVAANLLVRLVWNRVQAGVVALTPGDIEQAFAVGVILVVVFALLDRRKRRR